MCLGSMQSIQNSPDCVTALKAALRQALHIDMSIAWQLAMHGA